ncbi:hypothetical protein TVAG_439190 [Trichomonas vaginalis G3]|uniref:Uncharacterized protein n=1 Tax=Trichomonas vaginalis (strain ATCC PRA-98 / G3) TaxID=412133 RepID=A2FQY6_TRIV3|nr:hypothetical protein TVAGG3_0236090 [Trichomonas vaginalis G3]EAX92691.1 hypothetical protein TVAG_439190 [Trichomonas vaginalis G3]KAI5553004.1 hypothetical protein TVAGG3_0236090 [Trichomonas vaginalis G3]|eukprot:XP_001305621.1 hypothetical protein [Trichomonas vaginalis G3]
MNKYPKSARPMKFNVRAANNILFQQNRKGPKIVSPRCSHKPNESQMSNKAIRDLLLNDNLDEIEKYATHALMGEKLPDLSPYELSLVAKDLENRRAYFIDKGYYNKSLQAKAALDHVKELQLIATKIEAQKQEQTEIFLIKGYSKTDYTIFNHKMTAEEDKLNLKYENKLLSIEERQEKEKKDLEEEWHSKAKLRMYSHPSTKLIELKHVQKRLLDANELDKAAALKQEIDELELKERQEGARNWTNDYNRAVEMLAAKHAAERDFYDYDKDLKQQVFKAKVDIGSIAFDNRNRALKIRETVANDMDKYWRTHSRSIYEVAPPPPSTTRSRNSNYLNLNFPN